ncbi:MAG TPA: TlpA disulfide reductase family protein, partial [Chitinophagaceae bacterium]|nr:TlpA disulfide reductase family protein [Chitinophagaceae bacterium]
GTVASVKPGNIKLTDLKGVSIDLIKYKGKVVFINFWATWCKPCIEEIPTIKNAIGILNNDGIEFLFASDETTEQIESFEKKHSYKLNYVKAGNLEELGIMVLPTTFIFNREGKQVFSEMGYRKWDDKANLDLLSQIANEE